MKPTTGWLVGLGISALVALTGAVGLAEGPATEPAAIASDAQHPIAIPAPDAADGGWADGGPTGEYFANPTWSGAPAFTRHDVRIDFDWGKLLPIGGSPAEPYQSFPHQHFSVRWTGRVVPRFSEDYVFAVAAADGVRLKLRPAGVPNWTVALDVTDKPGITKPIYLNAGQPCDVVLEYPGGSGAQQVSLHWSCASAPDQVIDPVVAQGLNASSWTSYIWADALKASRYSDRNQSVDAQGEPTSDFRILINEGGVAGDGTFALSFHGKAEVKSRGIEFAAGGQTWNGDMPYGSGYDPATNTTSATVHNPRAEGIWELQMISTSRAGAVQPPAVPGDGVTDLHLMRPTQPGAATANSPGQVVYGPFRDATAPYTCLRWLQSANSGFIADWSKRTHPDELTFTRGAFFGNADTGGETWEMLIALANETGKDLYVALPMSADDAYIEKFARLIRYGSDGVEPYDHAVANPKWPPLNPNLRLYVEMGNEIWNWSFGSTQYCLARNNQEVKDQTPDGKILSYDGKSNWRRWHALRTVQASNVFRKILGDDAMGSRLRLLVEYQYNNANNTARASYDFLDKWFNNGDGNHVADPHPIRYYAWGGGGATYYGVGNPTGEQTAITFPDPHFENGFVADGAESAAPAGSGWTLTGDASIYRNHLESIASFVPGTPGPVAKVAAAGCTFRVDKPVYLRAIGCWLRMHAGAHDLYLLGPSGVMAHASIEPLKYTMSETTGWVWDNVAGDPQRLDPGVDYHLLVKAKRGNPDLYVDPVAVAPGPGFHIVGAIKVMQAGDDPKTWKIESAGDGALSYGPLEILASSAADTKPTEFPEPFIGGQAVVIHAGATFSTKINFPKAGDYALTFHSSGAADQKATPMVYFSMTMDGKSIDPVGQGDDRVSPNNHFGMGGFERRTNQLSEIWGTAVFHVDAPGLKELRVTGDSRGKGWTVFNEFRVNSVDAIMESGFGAGQALGQVAQNNYAKQLDGEATYARSFGLPDVAYEAGWSLGGDFHAMPIQTWCKFHDPRATSINNVAEDTFMKAGGCMNVWGVYTYWPAYDTVHALTYPLMQSIAALSARLPAEATNGIPLPTTLKATLAEIAFDDTPYDHDQATFSHLGQWKSWLTIAPTSGVWSIAVHAKGGGTWELEVDGISVGRAAGDATAFVRLVKGQHAIRLRNRGGAFTLGSIDITAVK